MSLLWLPYLTLGFILITLAIASFCKYHFKYRDKYRKTIKINVDIKQTAQKYKVTLNKNASTDQHSSEIDLQTFYSQDNQRLNIPDITKLDKMPSWSNQNEIFKENNSFNNNHGTQEGMHISSIYHQVAFDSRYQPIEDFTSYSPYERRERFSDLHDNGMEFYPANPPPPPKRNLHNVNRYRQLQFVRNSFHRNSDKDWDSGYYSTSNHVKLEESNPYKEAATQQGEGEIAMIHNVNYKHYTKTMNSCEPSTLYTEKSELGYQSQVTADDRENYAISGKRDATKFHYNLYQDYPTSENADRPLHHST